MKWTNAFYSLSLVSALLCLPLQAAAQVDTDSLKAEASAVLEKGDTYRAYGLFEEAMVEDMANGNKVGVAQGLTDLGRVLAVEESFEKALSHYRSALLAWVQLEDVDGAVHTLMAMADVYESLGNEEKAAAHSKQALQLIDGNISIGVVISTAVPLACGADKSITPDKAKLPGGSWTAWGIGTSEASALQSALQQAFTGMGYLPTCKDKCPDGTAPARGECEADVNSSLPTSTTPADYGSSQWTISNKPNGQVVIGPVTITKFPAGLTANQSCSACC